MRKKIVAISLVLVMVIPVAACAGEGEEAAQVEEGTELPSAQEIVDGVTESLVNVRTQQFDMEMTMDMVGEAEGEAFEMTTAMGFSGSLDLENRQMGVDISMTMTMPGEDEVEMEMEMYLIDNMGYVMMDVPEMGPTWMKSEISEADWEEIGEQISQTESQIELLKTAQVKVISSEKVRGVDCYVLQLTPDMEQLWQIVMQQQEIAGGEIPDVAEEFIREMFRNFSVKQWVAKDTYFLTRAEVEMTVELTPEAMGFPEEEGEMKMDISMTLLAYNYNESVSIVLPAKAEEAPDLSQEQEGDAAETELATTDALEQPATESAEPLPPAPPPVSFEMQGWEVINEVDSQYQTARAYLAVYFSSDEVVSLTLTDPSGSEIGYSHQVSGQVGEVRLPMTSSSWETPVPGTYTVTVNSWLGETVTTVEVGDFIGAGVSVTDVRFVGFGGIISDTLQIEVVNDGDLPAYIKRADIQIGSVSVDMSGEWNEVILPDEAATLYCEWYSTGDTPDTPTVHLELKDNAGNVVTSSTNQVTLVPWDTYIDWTWGFAIRYPAAWAVTEDISSNELFVTIESPSGEAYIAIGIDNVPGSQLGYWVSRLNTNRQVEWISYEVVSDEEISWSGLPARRIVWKGRVEIGDEVAYGNELYFKEEQKIYSVQVIAVESYYSVYPDRLDAMFNSFGLMR